MAEKKSKKEKKSTRALAVVPATQLEAEDLRVLESAKRRMENIGWAMEGLNQLGNKIDKQVSRLSEGQQKQLQQISYTVLQRVVQSNLKTMDPDKAKPASLNTAYQAMASLSGAIGGAFGFVAFAADMALTTKLMMRSIMDIARSEGEDLRELDTQLACLQVFALGGKSKHDDSLDTGYYALRMSIRSALRGVANPLAKAIGQVAGRFSVQVTEKFAAQAVPVIGAVGGAAINTAFMTHFQNMAEAHFAVRRLERKYGMEAVEAAYHAIGDVAKKT
ncbi:MULTISPECIES: EcsC family protein [unclassified Robiginitalea]|uniref:EcsC family protein n=1 Tax=Robiginitalea TaxID=252306 RepID=UPI00234A5783|nr:MULTISPECIES: EcsC family protein [unclassified Robiginitalea]MDC6353267.1 EcsC family protein [Robiginitalea sp. PM2]MDC6373567.1 EcsC family protein [Robiginitalea sp. SP8]